MPWIEAARHLLIVTGYAFIIFSLVPLIKSHHWLIRVFDYPRSQKFWISLIVLLLFLTIADFNITYHKIFAGLLSLNVVYLLTAIWNYTPFASIQMKKGGEVESTGIRILIANVFQDNDRFDLCLARIREQDPDIILLVETNDVWTRAIEKELKNYPHRVLQPQENTYGMLLFSKLKIVKHEIRFLVEEDVPSITADIQTDDGKRFRLYGLHPKPPVPQESEDSTDRDAEILLVGKEARKCHLPVIVAGDLNDVAWSHTTNLFLKVSGLLDPRIGRGFFSTFHARYRFFRWPLDHVFCSSHFYLSSLRRLHDIGSDHFPIFIEVALMREKVKENKEEVKQPDKEDLEMADETIAEARE